MTNCSGEAPQYRLRIDRSMACAAIDRRRCSSDINRSARSRSSCERIDAARGSSESAISSKIPHTCTSPWCMAIGDRHAPSVSNGTRWKVTFALPTRLYAPLPYLLLTTLSLAVAITTSDTVSSCQRRRAIAPCLLTILHIDNPAYGEVREWPNRAVSKTAVGVTRPWVRSPPSPPQGFKKNSILLKTLWRDLAICCSKWRIRHSTFLRPHVLLIHPAKRGRNKNLYRRKQ